MSDGAEVVLAHNDSLRREIKRLRRELAKAERAKLSADEIRKVILELRDADLDTPRWAKQKLTLDTDELVPVLCLSDVHYGEVVKPAAVNGVNRYNPKIARDRIQRMIDKTVLLCRSYVHATYPGIVVAMLGDLYSGSIHEELDATNALTAPQSLLDMLGILRGAFVKLADEFGNVRVVSVAGNHGRLDVKPRYKDAALRNLDWLTGCLLEREFRDDKRLTWHVSSAADARFDVRGTVFSAMHGESFKGGSGIQGALAPIMIGDYRRRQSAQATERDYDYLLIGHWHRQMNVGGIIVNGSVKGYDEYAAGKNFPFEPPQQHLFLVRGDGRIAYWLPVFLD